MAGNGTRFYSIRRRRQTFQYFLGDSRNKNFSRRFAKQELIGHFLFLCSFPAGSPTLIQGHEVASFKLTLIYWPARLLLLLGDWTTSTSLVLWHTSTKIHSVIIQGLRFWPFRDIILNWASKALKIFTEFGKWKEMKQYLTMPTKLFHMFYWWSLVIDYY